MLASRLKVSMKRKTSRMMAAVHLRATNRTVNLQVTVGIGTRIALRRTLTVADWLRARL